MIARQASALRDLVPNLVVPLPNVAGAATIYFYFFYVDPGPRGMRDSPRDLTVFSIVTGAIIIASMLVGARWFQPVGEWLQRLRAGEDAAAVPREIRRRALNMPLANAVSAMAGWTLAGIFYFPYQLWFERVGLEEAVRIFSGIVFLGGPIAATLSFLVSEVYWRRRIPLFFPQ